jgi:dsDNA-specific endonuclease/ATPase MutS2
MHQTLEGLNELHREFWDDINTRFQLTIATYPGILQEALADLEANSRRYSFRQMGTLEEAVFDVEQKRDLHLREFSRRGVEARKTDDLSRLIEDLVKKRPSLSCSELLIELKELQPIPPVADINEHDIVLSDGKTIPLTALKDRLFRAKKKVKSRDR